MIWAFPRCQFITFRDPSIQIKQIEGCIKEKRKSGWESGLVVSKLDSRLEGCGFKSHPMVDGNGVKAMLGSIPAHNPGSFNNWKKIIGKSGN